MVFATVCGNRAVKTRLIRLHEMSLKNLNWKALKDEISDIAGCRSNINRAKLTCYKVWYWYKLNVCVSRDDETQDKFKTCV